MHLNSEFVIRCDSATEFVEKLLGVLLEEREPEIADRFVFRGQGDSSWRLVPSAFRSGTSLGYESREYARKAAENPADTWEQGNAEFVALMEFLNLAVKVGLDIPVDYRWLRQWNPFQNVVGHSIGTAEWPPQELLQALALAQHHGVPTRLLDFSYDPLIAAYFAAYFARGGGGPQCAAKEIAVWCVDVQLILLAAKDLNCRVQFVTVPNYLNKNLTAQKGLFLLDASISHQSYALEKTIAEHVWKGEQGGRVPAGSCAVRKYCLPSPESGSLLNTLRNFGVDRAHLMPSFDGVVEELKLRQRNREIDENPSTGTSS